MEGFLDTIPARRLGVPEEVVKIIFSCLCEEASTVLIIVLSNGRHMLVVPQ